MSRTEFKILKEDDFWAAVYKPAGLHSDEIAISRSGSEAALKPVHRLDYETQGILLLATEEAWQQYHFLFKDGASSTNSTEKIYLAGSTKEVPTGHYRGFIGSRYRSSKVTRYEEERGVFRAYHSVLEAEHIVEKAVLENPNCPMQGNLYQVQLLSGRRHQIRAFFASYEAPLVGDNLYGDTSNSGRIELLSWKLNFVDPIRHKKTFIEADPKLFQKL